MTDKVVVTGTMFSREGHGRPVSMFVIRQTENGWYQVDLVSVATGERIAGAGRSELVAILDWLSVHGDIT